jgi:hypothetical protein
MCFDKSRPSIFAALGSDFLKHGEAIAVTSRRDHPGSGIDGHLERGLTE